MSNYYFSRTTLAFYPVDMLELYRSYDSLPDDITPVSDEIFLTYSGTPPEGKARGANDDGQPEWVDIPPMAPEEAILLATAQKQNLIDNANEYMNSKQWPGKAAIGRLKGDELAQYNLWLDYLDTLELVDTSGAPDIEWPTSPAVQAR
ncbi:tail fiber assembly protein [Citrobacter amalonaticus]|uniref:tail fiber assembly protein n=1 Tax=Citrobacter amalonaticus TaxID=35703 RepID=UPI001C7E1654|nr:tail fiber assembly protein [Citrobacter amalonaticus]QZA37999.1 tail fiber assembly protein [Citrobacter amalonaticus]HCN8150091.1 tail fiber assembly protein [Escherichia coli]HCP5408779.1 tail fiber assembly protein [Escherichia coli]HDU8562602.1 tail fiber assembly protein [Escherichia coli]